MNMIANTMNMTNPKSQRAETGNESNGKDFQKASDKVAGESSGESDAQKLTKILELLLKNIGGAKKEDDTTANAVNEEDTTAAETADEDSGTDDVSHDSDCSCSDKSTEESDDDDMAAGETSGEDDGESVTDGDSTDSTNSMNDTTDGFEEIISKFEDILSNEDMSSNERFEKILMLLLDVAAMISGDGGSDDTAGETDDMSGSGKSEKGTKDSAKDQAPGIQKKESVDA